MEGSSNGTGPGLSSWTHVSEEECWAHCESDPLCFQADYTASLKNDVSKCVIGLNKMKNPPIANVCPECINRCYAKTIYVEPFTIREEKFIAENDVVSSIITSDKPVLLEISGRSYGEDSNIVSVNGKCSVDIESNSIHIEESGIIRTKVSIRPDVIKNGTLVYEGMSGVLTASRPLTNVELFEVSPGVCGYKFVVPLDESSTTISWTMDDSWSKALNAVSQVQADPVGYMEAKTRKMNDLLNNYIPYFRCSDEKIVKIYYYLWSIYLMFYTQGDKGMQKQPHTQTAVQNFLGLHRWDSIFQIQVGSWVSPEHHEFYANGNVLAWKDVLPYRKGPALPGNFGIDWVSGTYTENNIAHIIGAWQIYEHSGNITYLAEAYELYKELFWEDIGGDMWMLGYDSVLCLNKMADVLGVPEDAAHWNASIGMDKYHKRVEDEWERDTPNMFGRGENGIVFNNVAPGGVTMFPREYVEAMAREWLDDALDGFSSYVPLCGAVMRDWTLGGEGAGLASFATTPDANWYLMRGLYIHNIDDLANKFLLGHLEKYHMEWGIPSSTEGRRLDGSLFGDKYSNFNAGKILLILDGMGGLKYSVPEDSFTFADNLPKEWSFMEFHVPVLKGSNVTWVKARAERLSQGGKVRKVVKVESNPFERLIIQPWVEEAEVTSIFPEDHDDATLGHKKWGFNTESAEVVLNLTIH